MNSPLLAIRPAKWPKDRAAVLELDASFVTDRVYQLERNDAYFELRDVAVQPVIEKSYNLSADLDAIASCDYV